MHEKKWKSNCLTVSFLCVCLWKMSEAIMRFSEYCPSAGVSDSAHIFPQMHQFWFKDTQVYVWSSNTCLIGLGSSSISMRFSGSAVSMSPFIIFNKKPLRPPYKIFEECYAFEKLKGVEQTGCLKIGWYGQSNEVLFLMPLLTCIL